jgi:hypothetical protein
MEFTPAGDSATGVPAASVAAASYVGTSPATALTIGGATVAGSCGARDRAVVARWATEGAGRALCAAADVDATETDRVEVTTALSGFRCSFASAGIAVAVSAFFSSLTRSAAVPPAFGRGSADASSAGSGASTREATAGPWLTRCAGIIHKTAPTAASIAIVAIAPSPMLLMS